jgi:pilus assembly protein CpaE
MTGPSPRPAANADAKAQDAPLPRLSVHAFCEDEGTAELLRAAGGDRRLLRTGMTVQIGGVMGACSFYEKAPTPNLIIVESLLDGTAMLTDLEKLALVCEPETKVLVIGHVNDVPLYRELMRRGVSDYLVPPFSAEDAADSILGVFAAEAGPMPGRVLAFIGAKGGVGSSTIAHNVGWTLAEDLASEAIIADLDLAFGTAGLNFNQDPHHGVSQALAAWERLDEAMLAKLLCKCSDRLNLLAASSDLTEDREIDPQSATRLVEVLSRSAANVVLDLPQHWSPWLKQVLIYADDVVITAEPDLANLRNAKHLLDTIAEFRSKDRPAILVLNRVSTARRPEIAPRDFANAVGLIPAAVIDFDPALFGTAANNGLMIGEVSRKGKVADQFRALATSLARRTTAAAPREEGVLPMLARLMGKRSAG